MRKTVCELFAGVGGFRLGLERLHSGWETVWFSQWEPGASAQWAHACYVDHFGDCTDLAGKNSTGVDIAQVDKAVIPDHSLLVGGFPCQDYSVARSLGGEKGICGKKGVLWWQIYEIMCKKAPPFCLFENVDRLLKSPSKQRGRDFGIMLSSLRNLGYVVEWRVVNAAQYGAAQRRRRTFIFAARRETVWATQQADMDAEELLREQGFFARAFPVRGLGEIRTTRVSPDPFEATLHFQFDFRSAGLMRDGQIYTADVEPVEEAAIPLGRVLEHGDVDADYFIADEKMSKWTFLKGAKKIPRTAKNGHRYVFSEGPIPFPDPQDKPSRTMLTSEATLNRSTHVVEDPLTHRYRLLTPLETERLQGFNDNWTNTGMPVRMRYFCMGNALVVPMITRMGAVLDQIFLDEPDEELPPAVGEVAFVRPRDIPAPVVQMTLFEPTTVIYSVISRPTLLVATCRTGTRQWIREHNMYNYRISGEDLVKLPELKSAKHLIVKHRKTLVGYYRIQGVRTVDKGFLARYAYPLKSSKSPKTQKYLLFRLVPLKSQPPEIAPSDCNVLLGHGVRG